MRALMNKVGVKCSGTRGETLVEVLAAIVISGLAIMLLATVISVALSLNKQSEQNMLNYYTASNTLVDGATLGGGIKGSMRLDLTDGAGTTKITGLLSFDEVEYTVNKISDKPIISYKQGH